MPRTSFTTPKIAAAVGPYSSAVGANGFVSFADVVRVGVYLTDAADYPTLNEVYARQFDKPYPARTVIMVAALPLGARAEIDLIAVSG